MDRYACHNPRCELHVGAAVNPYDGTIQRARGYGHGHVEERRGRDRGESRPRGDDYGVDEDERPRYRRASRRRRERERERSRARRDASAEEDGYEEVLCFDYHMGFSFPFGGRDDPFGDDFFRSRRRSRSTRRERFDDDDVLFRHVHVTTGPDPLDDRFRGDRMRSRFRDSPAGGDRDPFGSSPFDDWFTTADPFKRGRGPFTSTPDRADTDRLRRRFTRQTSGGYPPSSNRSFYSTHGNSDSRRSRSQNRRKPSQHRREPSRPRRASSQPPAQAADQNRGQNPWYVYVGTEGPDGEIID